VLQDNGEQRFVTSVAVADIAENGQASSPVRAPSAYGAKLVLQYFTRVGVYVSVTHRCGRWGDSVPVKLFLPTGEVIPVVASGEQWPAGARLLL
jgi:hypothetical protein